MAPTIVLLGRDGQVGWQLQRSLAPFGRVVALGRADCDLADLDALRRTVNALAPTLIVNAAAYTDVDRAESEPGLARRINADAVAALATIARARGALLVHYSTDYVFDGTQGEPYAEDDAPAPLNVYGTTKLEGEQAIAASGCRALVLRTSWVFGARGRNFVKSVLRRAEAGGPLFVVADQVGNPTPAAMISDVTGLLLAARRRGAGFDAGVHRYHLAAGHPVSRHAFARAIVEVAAATPGFALQVGPDDVVPVATADHPLPARRPADARLDCRRLEADFDLDLPDWRPYLERMMQLLALKRANGY